MNKKIILSTLMAALLGASPIVAGDTTIFTNGGNSLLIRESSSTDFQTYLTTTQTGMSRYIAIAKNGDVNAQLIADSDLGRGRIGGTAGVQDFEMFAAGSLIFTAGNGGNGYQTAMTIKSGGNVGISTTTPQATLDVNGAVRIAGVLDVVSPIRTTGAGSYLYTTSRFNGGSQGAILVQNGSNNNFGICELAADKWTLGYFNALPPSSATLTSVITYDKNGNVGIGTTNPSEKLTVKGSILASRIKVVPQSEIPDYVFEKNYTLKPISELEAYVQKYKHLPNIPSREDMKKSKQIDVGDMQLKMLEKIEELTLYVVALSKKDQALVKENESLQTRVSSLEKKLQGEH